MLINKNLTSALKKELTKIGTHTQQNYDNGVIASGYVEEKYNPNTGFYRCRWCNKSVLTRSLNDDVMNFGNNYSKGSSLRDGVSFLEIFNEDYKTAARVQHLVARHLLDTCELCVYDKKARIRRPIRNRKEIWDIFNMKKTAGNEFIKKMQDANLLVEADVDIKTKDSRKKQSRFFFNPVILCRPIHIEAFNFFREWLRPYLYPSDYKAMEKIYSILHDPLQRDEIEKAAAEKELENTFSNIEALEFDEELINFIDKDTNPKTQDDHMAIFRKTVLRGYAPQLCGPYSYWKLTDKSPDDSTNVYFCTQHMKDLTDGHKAENVAKYRNICIDIDLGKDDSGAYIPDINEVKQRKAYIYKTLMAVLPTPSCVIDTRNGYHFYWSTSLKTNYKLWHTLASEIKASLTGIIDPVVTCDAGRVLRMPGSIHKKEGCEPYNVTILHSEDKIYTYTELSKAFKRNDEKIKAAKNDIIAKYPIFKQDNNKINTFTTKYKNIASTVDDESIPYEEQSPRVQDIIDLTANTFDDMPAVTVDYDGAVEYIKANIDLADFLGIESPSCFWDVFHVASHASATIYAPDNNAHYWRYVCHAVNNGRPVDIINCVQLLAGCDFKTALAYICRVYNISIQPQTTAA